METQIFITAALLVALFSIVGYAVTSTAEKVKELERRFDRTIATAKTENDDHIDRLRRKAADWEIRYKETLDYAARLEQESKKLYGEILELKADLNKAKFDYACEVAGGKRSKKEKPEDEKA